MAEDGLQSAHIPKDSESVGSVPMLAKVGEMVVAIFAVGLVVDPFNSFQRTPFGSRSPKLDDIAMIYITFGSFLIINSVMIICYFLGDNIPKKMSMIFSTLGALFHIIAASLIIHNWRKLNGGFIQAYNNEVYASKQYLDMLISGAFFTFLEATIFVFDVFLTFRYS